MTENVTQQQAPGWRWAKYTIVIVPAVVVFVCIAAFGIYYWKEYLPHPESRALACLDALHNAQETYKKTTGHYASTLQELGSFDGGSLQGDVLDWGAGYTYTIASVRKDPSGTVAGYLVDCRPKIYGHSTRYSYLLDETGAIRYTRENRPATLSDPSM